MIFYPAIDLKAGNCVRLYQGDMLKATVFNHSPANQAQIFQKQGFKFLHIVDLDGAFAGNSANQKSVIEIINNIQIPAQLGGGIRSLDAIEKWLELGLARVILGTVALQNPALVREAARKFPKQIAVGIDSKNGLVATSGWVEHSTISTIEIAKRFEGAGVAAIVYTDISRDGTGNGVDLEGSKNLAASVNIPIIASGGVGSIQDIIKIKQLNLSGAIIGRALYDNKINPKQLLALEN